MFPSSFAKLQCGAARFTGPDPYHLPQVSHEDLAIANLVGVRCLSDRLNGRLNPVVIKGNLYFYLGQKIDDVFSTPIELGMALLPPEALDFGYRQALNANLRNGIPDIIELERFDYCCDEFQRITLRRKTGNIGIAPKTAHSGANDWAGLCEFNAGFVPNW
jgi:hypothetical protein